MDYMFNVIWTDGDDSIVVSAEQLNDAWDVVVSNARHIAGVSGAQIESITYVNSSADI